MPPPFSLMDFLVLLSLAAYVFIGCYIWSSIIDRSFRRKPSQWLGFSYLSGLTMLLGYGGKYLDSLITHPYRSAAILLVGAMLFGLSAVYLFARAKQWDKRASLKRG